MKLPELAPAILRRCLRRCALPFAIGIALAGFAPTMDLATAKKLPPHAKRAVVAKAVAPASAIPAEPFSNDVPAKSELTVGGLHATLAADDLKTAIAAGGSAYLNVTIAEAGGNQQVSLIAEAEAGSIRSISGTGVKSSPVAGGLAAQIALPAKGSTNIAVEFALQVSGKGPDGRPRGRLRLTLLPQKGGRDVTIVALPVADCASDYKAELVKLDAERRQRMVSTLDAVAAAEPGLPSAWLFPPAKLAKPVVVACKVQKGRKQAACPVAQLLTGDATASPEDAAIFERANAVQQQKGALPQFQHRTQPFRQASFTLLNSLRMYMEQDPHPALCNGVDYMIGYYQGRTSLVKSAIADAQGTLATAQSLAAAKVAAIAPKVSGPPQADADELLDRIAGAVLPAVQASAFASLHGTWSKLAALRLAMTGAASPDLTPSRRAEAEAAASMIEASQYLAIAATKYSRLDETIYGTMSAIADAHKRTCVCGT